MVDFNPARGSEQAGIRPALVVSNDVNNQHGAVVIVAAITKTIPKKPYPFTVHLPGGAALAHDGTILCAQLMTVDKGRLMRHRGDITSDQLKKVDAALVVSLGLPRDIANPS
jgi:mRNA interferase MazF